MGHQSGSAPKPGVKYMVGRRLRHREDICSPLSRVFPYVFYVPHGLRSGKGVSLVAALQLLDSLAEGNANG